MQIRYFISLITLMLGIAVLSLLITASTQAKTAVQNEFSCADVDTASDMIDDGVRNDSAYLTVKELGQALDAPNVAPVDVLHLDACLLHEFGGDGL